GSGRSWTDQHKFDCNPDQRSRQPTFVVRLPSTEGFRKIRQLRGITLIPRPSPALGRGERHILRKASENVAFRFLSVPIWTLRSPGDDSRKQPASFKDLGMSSSA